MPFKSARTFTASVGLYSDVTCSSTSNLLSSNSSIIYRDTISRGYQHVVKQSETVNSNQLPRIKEHRPNIVVFGETGVGKSSVVNMLDDSTPTEEHAEVGDTARGITFDNKMYEKQISGRTFSVFDTAGLGEVSRGKVPGNEAIEKLYHLLRELEGGVNLLVYVATPRITMTTKNNYELFHNIICRKNVNIVLILTHLEESDDREAWWRSNKEIFEKEGLSFTDVACVTASKGKLSKQGKHVYEEEYEASKEEIRRAIATAYQPKPWSPPGTGWFIHVLTEICIRLPIDLGIDRVMESNTLCSALINYGNLSARQASARAKAVEKRIREGKAQKAKEEAKQRVAARRKGHRFRLLGWI